MENRHEQDGFYPYLEQQKHGRADVPVVESLEEHHRHHYRPRKKIDWLVVILLLLVAAGAFIFAYNRQARERYMAELALTPTVTPTIIPSPTATPTPTMRVPQFPYPDLQEAYEKTTNAQTMRAGFISDVITTYTRDDGSEQKLESRAEGYLFGASDGTTIQTELRITQKDDPSKTAFFGQILVDNELFIKLDTDDWVRRNRSDYNKLHENQPIDATAYAYFLLDTLFTRSKALLRGIDERSVVREPDTQLDGKQVQQYTFGLSIAEYLAALERDPNTAAFTIKDARKILANATVSGRIFVDPETKYILRIQASASNLTQISTDEQVELGVRTSHQMAMVANLLDFDTPLSLVAPR
ncbi:MAG: hypothetical protein N2691_05230 [Patescibacteria group bacterium]|nr:hypothetical protein [Patescibacteria group bacterium]